MGNTEFNWSRIEKYTKSDNVTSYITKVSNYINAKDDTTYDLTYIDKAFITLKDQNGMTALHYAILQGNIKFAIYLLDNGANPTIKENTGKTALHYAVENPVAAKEIIDYLVQKKKIDVNTKDNNNNTPLHDAVANSNNNSVQYLLQNGADPLAKNQKGETPCDLCTKVREYKVNHSTETYSITDTHIINPKAMKYLNDAVIKSLDHTIVQHLSDKKKIAVAKMGHYASFNANHVSTDTLLNNLWDAIEGIVISQDMNPNVKDAIKATFMESCKTLSSEIKTINSKRANFNIFAKLWDNFLRALSHIFDCNLDYTSTSLEKEMDKTYDSFTKKLQQQPNPQTSKSIS